MDSPSRRDSLRDAAAIETFVALLWLTDLALAFAGGARWMSIRFVLPSLGFPLFAGLLAFALASRARRRVRVAIALLVVAGAFLLSTFRLAVWPAHLWPWL